LSLAVGIGMVALIPFAAMSHNPTRMIILQGVITTSAVVVCLVFARPLGLVASDDSGPPLAFLPMLKEVWTFGSIQLAGLIGVNFAGWWLTTLVARSDTTLVQMSFFAIASQLRNIAGLGPSMLTESSYAVMADPEAVSSTPQHVMALCTYASTFAAYLLAAIGIVFAPWVVQLIYGRGYSGAVVTVIFALSVAVVHMGNAPASARLSIVSIRALGVINTVWAIFVAATATIFLLHGGSAWKAMAVYLAGHVLSSTMVLFKLSTRDHIPAGMLSVFSISVVSAIALALLASFRLFHSQHTILLSIAMLGLAVGTTAFLWLSGRRHNWLPNAGAVHHLLESVLRPFHNLRRGGNRGV
jgi:hypothetical protein